MKAGIDAASVFWSTDEDNLLVDAMRVEGSFDPVAVSRRLSNKVPQQCQERYEELLEQRPINQGVTEERQIDWGLVRSESPHISLIL